MEITEIIILTLSSITLVAGSFIVAINYKRCCAKKESIIHEWKYTITNDEV